MAFMSLITTVRVTYSTFLSKNSFSYLFLTLACGTQAYGGMV